MRFEFAEAVQHNTDGFFTDQPRGHRQPPRPVRDGPGAGLRDPVGNCCDHSEGGPLLCAGEVSAVEDPTARGGEFPADAPHPTSRSDPESAGEDVRVFRDLDTELAHTDPGYRFDAGAGLARLEHALTEQVSARFRCLRSPSRPAGHEPSSPAAARRASPARLIADSRRSQLVITSLAIASRLSPEVARPLAVGLHGERWTVSWLPDLVCTREQALVAMVLDEILIEPEDLDSATIMQIVRELARELDLSTQEALARLSAIKNRPGYPLHRWSRHRTDLPGAASG
ncbi:hypothetical protein [Nocardia sp. NPDC057227]|uniref:hypothetical protein n=1 Tax=Nocardia sp. NPDC057227 TaxID=3346056 RepID=UPI0036259E81